MTTKHLAESARLRAQRALEAVKDSLQRLQAAGSAISMRSVAEDAGVSRNYIYSNAEARELVMAARSVERLAPRQQTLSAASSDDSLRSRLSASINENDELRALLELERNKNAALIDEVLSLQNPMTGKNVVPIRKSRF